MKRAFASLLVVLFLAIQISAMTADTESAQRVASNWAWLLTELDLNWTVVSNSPQVASVEELGENGVTVGYYIEYSPNGWIVVPASTDLAPILAYSDKGTLNFESPSGLATLILQILTDRIAAAEKFANTEYASTFSENELSWEQLSVSDPAELLQNADRAVAMSRNVGPLTQSDWNQRAPYNDRCPAGDPNCQTCPSGSQPSARTLVGCVATATAQIMNFHQWPLTGIGNHSFNWTDNSCGNSPQAQVLSADFADVYDWANILNDYSGGETAEQEAAVAELCYEVAVAFEMNFGVCASGAFTAAAVGVLADRFRYYDAVDRRDRDDFTETEWFEMIQGEIDLGRPILYDFRYDNDGGHAIIVDGWRVVNNENQYSLNYGWGGANNAWFVLDNIPHSDPTDEEFMVRFIMPDNQELGITIAQAPDLVLNQVGQVSIHIMAPGGGNYHVEVRDDQGAAPPPWRWPSATSQVAELILAESHTFTLNVTPTDEIQSFQIWLHEEDLDGNQSVVDIYEVTLKCQTPISKALDWLAANQNKFSSMSAEVLGEPVGSAIDVTTTRAVQEVKDIQGSWDWIHFGEWQRGSNAGITALALQAFLHAGYSIDDPVFGETILRAINYLLSIQTTSGYNTGAIANQVHTYETAMSIVALKRATDQFDLGEPLETEIDNALDLALHYLTSEIQQSWPSVSWRYDKSFTSPDRGDLSVSQWVFLALDIMEYRDKGVWEKVYEYIRRFASFSADQACSGYYRGSGWSRGNTFAAIWGLILARDAGVEGAGELAEKFYNCTDNYCPLDDMLSPANIHYTSVYQGGGYYYYVYELAKALAMRNKKKFCPGENWFPELYDRIVCQHFEDENGYYWTTGFSDQCDNYTIASGGPGNYANTALAILSLQVDDLPDGSHLVIRVRDRVSGPTPAGAAEQLYMTVTDNQDNTAGFNSEGGWQSEIPNSRWNHTDPILQEFEVIVDSVSSFRVDILNNKIDTAVYDYEVEAYYPSSDEPISAPTYVDTIASGDIHSSDVLVNDINGLRPRPTPPECTGRLEIVADTVTFLPVMNDSTYEFTFDVAEVSGCGPLNDIDIWATDLVDELDNVIDSAHFAIDPSRIDVLDANDSSLVRCTLHVPPESDMNFDGTRWFFGSIIVEAAGQTRRVPIKAANTGGFRVKVLSSPDNTVIAGVPVDIYDAYGNLAYSGHTDASGIALKEWLRYGVYEIVAVPPLGYESAYDLIELIEAGTNKDVALTLAQKSITPSQKPSGHWRHEVACAYSGDECPRDQFVPVQYRFPQLVDVIYQHFQQNVIHPIPIFEDGVMLSVQTKLKGLHELLSGKIHHQLDPSLLEILSGKTDQTSGFALSPEPSKELALRELTALLLNLATEKLATFHQGTKDGMTVGQVVTYGSDLIFDETRQDFALAYELFRRLNTGYIVGPGIIPSETPDVAYMITAPVEETLPTTYGLSQNYPNPFNMQTIIQYSLPEPGQTRLEVYNINGQLVRRLVDEYKAAGNYTVTWDGANSDGQTVASGVFVYRIESGDFVESRKMVLLK